jgi:dCMP deaminase
MPSQLQLDKKYLELARSWSQLSKAKRMQVGCIIVKGNQIISDGFNGTPAGFNNSCEDAEFVTKPEVLHAESNALMKLATSTNSSEGATAYITLSPCFECSKLLVQAKIKRVVYSDIYRVNSGIDLLTKAGITVEHV